FDRADLRGGGAVGRSGAVQFDLGRRTAFEAVGRRRVDDQARGQGDHGVFEVGGGDAFGVFDPFGVLVLGNFEVDLQARGGVGDGGGRAAFDRRFELDLVAAGDRR